MKKKQVVNVLGKQTKRFKKILMDILLIIILLIISFFCLIIFNYKNKPKQIKYTENSNLDYNVYLKNNDFFNQDYLPNNNQYIASLIDYVNAKFKYDLNIDGDVNYQYEYYIDAVVTVKDSNTNKNLYSYTEILKDKSINYVNSKKEASIIENVKIDYNKYNDLIKKFVNVYELEESYSNLKVNMHVSVLGNCKNEFDKDAVITLDIPLTTKTVNININQELIMDNNNNILFCKNIKNSYIYLILGIIGFIVDVIFAIICLDYIKKTRTPETIYNKKLRKILNNYKSYIQKVNNDFNFVDYQILKVDTFDDMLEIRDITQEPILMIENQSKTGVYFLIPSKTKILYSYGLKVSTIKEEMDEK